MPDGTPVEIDLRRRFDPDEVVRHTRPAADGRSALSVCSDPPLNVYQATQQGDPGSFEYVRQPHDDLG